MIEGTLGRPGLQRASRTRSKIGKNQIYPEILGRKIISQANATTDRRALTEAVVATTLVAAEAAEGVGAEVSQKAS
jgi:hypothetical protein